MDFFSFRIYWLSSFDLEYVVHIWMHTGRNIVCNTCRSHQILLVEMVGLTGMRWMAFLCGTKFFSDDSQIIAFVPADSTSTIRYGHHNGLLLHV